MTTDPRPDPARGRREGYGEFEVHLGTKRGPACVVRLRTGELTITGADGTPVPGVHLDDITDVRRDGRRVTVALASGVGGGGGPLVLDSAAAEQLEAAIVAACCTVPELTRALRSLGSSRTRTSAAAQRDFFAPLLEARRRAEESIGRAAIVGAFDPDRLERALDTYLGTLTEHSGDTRPAARRAFAAHAEEATEPLRAAIGEIRHTAPAAAAGSGPGIADWRRWSESLQSLFSAADRCWTRLQPVAGSGARQHR